MTIIVKFKVGGVNVNILPLVLSIVAFLVRRVSRSCFKRQDIVHRILYTGYCTQDIVHRILYQVKSNSMNLLSNNNNKIIIIIIINK